MAKRGFSCLLDERHHAAIAELGLALGLGRAEVVRLALDRLTAAVNAARPGLLENWLGLGAPGDEPAPGFPEPEPPEPPPQVIPAPEPDPPGRIPAVGGGWRQPRA